MCFSKSVSLFTFIIGFVSSIICLMSKNSTYKILGLFFLNVIMVQFTEYLLWSHLECDDYNKKIARLQVLIINFQPIILFIGIMIFNKNIKNKKVLLATIITYLLIIIPYTINTIKKNDCDVRCEETGKLDWNWTNYPETGFIYLFFAIIIGILGFYGLPMFNKLFPILTVGSYLMSGLIYKSNSGTMWCFFGALMPNLFLLLKN